MYICMHVKQRFHLCVCYDTCIRLYALHSLCNRFTHTHTMCAPLPLVLFLWRTFTILRIQPSIMLSIPTYTFPALARRSSEVILHAFHILTFVRRFSNFFFFLVHYVCVYARMNESVYLIILVIVSGCMCVCVCV